MKISLRKAHAIQHAIAAKLSSLKFVQHVSLDLYDDVETQVANTQNELGKDIESFAALSRILMDLRTVIGQANQDSGISNALAILAHSEAHLKLCQRLETTRRAKSIESLKEQVAASKTAEHSAFGGNSVTAYVMTDSLAEVLENQVYLSKKLKIEQQDEILAKNLSTFVELEDEIVKVLVGHKII